MMNWALPSMRILLSLIKGVIILSTSMEVPVLSLCERPIRIPWFQNDAPFQNSIPFVELAQSISPNDAPIEVRSVVGWAERRSRS